MLNEAPKPNLKQKVATTSKPGMTLKNLRLKQKGSQRAKTIAKGLQAKGLKAPAAQVAPQSQAAPYSAQNYKATMAKRRAAQKAAAASAAQKTKAVPVTPTTTPTPTTTAGQSTGGQSTGGQQTKSTTTTQKDNKKKGSGLIKKVAKSTALGAAALSIPVVALHMGEGRNMRTLRDVREKYTQKQRIMRDMGRNRGKDPSGAMKAKIAKDADELSKSYPGGGAPVRDKDIQRRAVGGYGGHEIERGVKKKQNYDFVPVSRDKLGSPDRPSPAERLKRKKEKEMRQMRMRKSGSGRDNVGGVGVREAKMVTGNETGMMFKVSIEGLPDMIMMGKSPGEIKGQLRKIVKQPSMIQGVERMPKSKVKMMYRDIVAGRDEEE